MIRIGFDTRYISENKTGLGGYSLSLLSELVNIGTFYEFVLFASDTSTLSRFESHDNVQIREVRSPEIRVSGRLSSLAYEQIWLANAMNKEKLDMIHFPYYLEPLLTRFPFILTVHDLDTFVPSGRHSSMTCGYHNFLLRILTRRAAIILTISEFTKREILKYLSVPDEKIMVVHDGLHHHFRESERFSSNDDFRRETTGKYLLYAGGLGMRKNLRRMVDAFARARQATGSDARLVITGEMAEVGLALKEYIERSGYSGFIDLIGYVPDEELPALYRGAIASIYPSLYEGFGLPVIESMACATPVITSRDSAMEEVADGRAVLVDPLDVSGMAAAIGALLTDSELAAAIGRRGPERARQFSWEKAARQCLDIYGQVLDGLLVTS